MGIQGLLPFVKNASREVDINSFSGATVAVDAYCWLHKGAFSCAEKLVKGENTDGYVYYCMKMVNVLLAAGVKPILVFDGCNLPLKKITEEKRRQNREKTKKKGKEFLREGKIKEAKECFQRCVDVTSEMAHNVIQACRKKNIDCIVAPYEADAQLAYLNKCGIAQIVISEDSDLILFGCEKILFKMDTGGRGIMVETADLNKCLGSRAEKFTFDKFRYMCILSGCDYLPSLPGIGLAKSCKFFSLITNSDLNVVLSKLPSYLKMPNLVVTSEYKEAFIKANNTFLYQLVYCPLKKKLVPLNPYPDNINSEELSYAGPPLPDDVAFQLALGNINVRTMKPVNNFDPAIQHSKNASWEVKENSPTRPSIWEENYKVSQCDVNQELLNNTVKKKEIPVKSQNVSMLNSCKKRQYFPKADLDIMPNDEVLYSMYSSSSKKIKLEPLSPEDTPHKSPQTSPKGQVLNQFKVIKASTPNSVVRSRFFFHPNTPNMNKEAVPKTSSWLDRVDKEYLIDSHDSSSDKVSQVVASRDSEENDKSFLDFSSRTGNKHDDSENSHQRVDNVVNTFLAESKACNKERSSVGFHWQSIKSMSKINEQLPSVRLSSSPASQSAFKQVSKLAKLIDNTTVMSSQNKNLSLDSDVKSLGSNNNCNNMDECNIALKSDSSSVNFDIGTPDSGIELSPVSLFSDAYNIYPDNKPSGLDNCAAFQKEQWCTSPDDVTLEFSSESSDFSSLVSSTVYNKNSFTTKKRMSNKSLKVGMVTKHHSGRSNAKTLKQTSIMNMLQKFQYKK